MVEPEVSIEIGDEVYDDNRILQRTGKVIGAVYGWTGDHEVIEHVWVAYSHSRHNRIWYDATELVWDCGRWNINL